MSAALLALLLAAVPELGGELLLDPPQGGGAVRRAASVEDRTRIAELFSRQDRLLLAGQLAEAGKDFDASFASADFHCDSSCELLERWQRYLAEHEGGRVTSELLHAERVGAFLVADVRRRIEGVRRDDGEPVRDESYETHVLRDAGGALAITTAYENEASKLPRIQREARVYDARASLCFKLTLPEPFVAVPRRGPGAALDELLLIDPADEAMLGLMVYDPTIDQPLEDLIWADFAYPGATWLVEPRRFERGPPGASAAFEVEVECPPCEPEGERKGAKRGAMNERAVYLSPDGRIVFSFWLAAPPAAFPRLKSKVDEMARSLRLTEVGANRPYTAVLLEKHPRWSTLEDGVFRPAAAAVELAIPPLMVATPLLGDHVVRLRLQLLDDPSSRILVRIFPGGEDRIAAERILDSTVRRLNAFACAEGEGGDSHRTDGTMPVLGSHGDWRGIEVVCRDGTRRKYQILAVDRDDCHLQVQVLPGSSNVEAQSGALKLVLDGLLPRGERAAVETAGK